MWFSQGQEDREQRCCERGPEREDYPRAEVGNRGLERDAHPCCGPEATQGILEHFDIYIAFGKIIDGSCN